MSADAMMESGAIQPSEQELLLGAGRRIRFAMIVLGLIGCLACWIAGGWRIAGGFAIGAALSAFSFRSLTGAVTAVSRLAGPPQSEVSDAASYAPNPVQLVIRLLLRYALIGVAGYAIFKSSFLSLGAFFLGLFLFLGAILGEVAYEIYSAFRGT